MQFYIFIDCEKNDRAEELINRYGDQLSSELTKLDIDSTVASGSCNQEISSMCELILRTLIYQLLQDHPFPWYVEYENCSVISRDGAIIAECEDEKLAEKIVQLAELIGQVLEEN